MMTVAIEKVAMMVNAILSDKLGKPADIESLTRRVSDLTISFDFWNHWMLWGLGFAAIAAFWVGLTTRMTVVRSKQLTVAQGDLDAFKEAQLNLDLKGKDEKIAVTLLEQEKLRNENLKLEERIAVEGHRSLRIAGSHDVFISRVKPFSGQEFEIGVCPLFSKDFEVMELQMNIESHLIEAGWKQKPDREWHTCEAGITVATWAASPRAGKAAEALTNTLDKILGKYSIEGDSGPQVGHFALPDPPKNPPAGTIYVGPSNPDVVLIAIGSHP